MRIGSAMLFLGLLTALPAAAQTTADETKAQIITLHLLVGQESALAKAYIALSEIQKTHYDIIDKADQNQASQAAAVCSRGLERRMSDAANSLQPIMELLGISSVMQTRDDRQAVSRNVSVDAIRAKIAIKSMAFSAQRYCRSDAHEYSDIRGWIVQTTSLIDRIKEAADAISNN